jgi:hypothetical protein
VNNRYVGLAMALVVMVVSQGAAGQQPDAAGTVGGCPAEPLAFHTCALAKAKTFNPPRTSSGKPNLQGYFVAAWPKRSRLKESRDPNRSWPTR